MNLVYKKRKGTSGVSGQLYETKLLSLILFRALHDDDIEEFYIGTNVDGLGEFDDICLRITVKGQDKPIAVFLQAKHRDQNKPITVTKSDLMKYFKSYMIIRSKFSDNSGDAVFKDAYEDVECAFVFYTNTKDELNKVYLGNDYISKINDIITTGDDAFQIPYTEDNFNLLNEMVLHEIVEKLVITIADIVRYKGNNYKTLMNDDLIQTYHVILSQHVFIIADAPQDTNTDYCIGRVNRNFFDTTTKDLQLLRNALVTETLKDSQLLEPTIRAIINSFPAFIPNNTDEAELRQRITEGTHDAECSIEEIVARKLTVICSDPFKLPVAFGNRDLNLRGDSSKKEKRLFHLENTIVTLLQNSTTRTINDDTFNIVSIDDDFPDKGFIRLNGGIASAVGNLLILDNKTRLLMFANGNQLTGHAKTLFDKINSKIEVLEKYRFDVKVKGFPKLSFDCNEHDKRIVVDFTNKLMFYTNQAREIEVEHILKGDIGRLQNTRERSNFQIKSDAIFQKYHDEIQKWWMVQKNAEYLTKSSQVFQISIECFIRNPLLGIASELYQHKYMKNDNIQFDAEVVDKLRFDESFSKITIVVSDVIALSVIKVTQKIKNEDYILIDLNYLLSLPEGDRSRLSDELTDVEDKTLILTYKLTQGSKLKYNLKGILQILKEKKLIVVTNKLSILEIRKCLAHADCYIVEDNISLIDLTEKSQAIISGNTDVIFQGVHVSLRSVLDNQSKVLINGELMDKIMNGEIIHLGDPLTNSRYEEIKDFYVSRRVTSQRAFNENKLSVLKADRGHHVEIKLQTFYDTTDAAVLIKAEPGMGKSSLLTHLSMQTKARNPGVWIVRINLLDYSRYFHQWNESKVVIDILEALRFICIAVDNQYENEKIILDERNREIFLKDCGTEVDNDTIFEISMFLNYYNRHRVVFAFDGFDEICPHYEPQVIQFLKALRDHRPYVHRIYTTSRTYSKILRSLEQVFGVSYQLQSFNFLEQQEFIERFFKLKLDLNELNDKQIEKINDFIKFMERSHSWKEDEEFSNLYKCRSLPLHTIYLNAAQYFKDEINRALYLKDKEKYVQAWDLNVHAMKIVRQYNGRRFNVNDMLEFIATPLHLYMTADYFQNEIKHVDTDTTWDLNLNTYAMYEHFVETKLRRIRFEEKNQMDLYRPDVQFTFERDKIEFINVHKKLAAYALFHEDVDQLFSETELDEIKGIVNTIDSGREKTGVIYAVIGDVPRFVHLSFAEYFAVEYICDLLKSKQSDNDIESLWNFILNTVFYKDNVGVLNILDDKLIMDDDFKVIVNDARSRRVIFDLLMKQSVGVMANKDSYDVCFVQYVNKDYEIHSALHKSMSENLRNLTSLFLSTLEYITQDNIGDLVKIITDTKAILDSVIIKNVEFTDVILDTVRNTAPSKMNELFNQIPRSCIKFNASSTNKVIADTMTRYISEVLDNNYEYFEYIDDTDV